MTQASPTSLFRSFAPLSAMLACVFLLGACAESAKLSVAQGTGPTPTLPEPAGTLIPTVNIAPAKGWPAGAAPVPAAGLPHLLTYQLVRATSIAIALGAATRSPAR